MSQSVQTSLSSTLSFYLDHQKNLSGDTLQGLWNRGKWWYYNGWKDLETKHDYIQWLFPNSIPSRFNPNAPVINQKDVRIFTKQEPERMNELRQRLLHSFHLMLPFYGLEVSDQGIQKACNFSKRALVWLTPDNHNFLRLTRILSSLELFGLPKERESLFQILREIKETDGKNIVSERTFAHWSQAGKPASNRSWLSTFFWRG